MAEVRPRLPLARIGPQEEGHALPGLGRLPVEEEIGEQRLSARRPERWQGVSPMAKTELVEEPNDEGRCLHRSGPLATGFRVPCHRSSFGQMCGLIVLLASSGHIDHSGGLSPLLRPDRPRSPPYLLGSLRIAICNQDTKRRDRVAIYMYPFNKLPTSTTSLISQEAVERSFSKGPW